MKQYERFTRQSLLAKTFMLYILIAPVVWDLLLEGVQALDETYVKLYDPIQLLYIVILFIGVYALNNKRRMLFSMFAAYNVIVAANLLYVTIPSMIDMYGPNSVVMNSLNTWLIVVTSIHSLAKALLALILMFRLLNEKQEKVRHIRSVS